MILHNVFNTTHLWLCVYLHTNQVATVTSSNYQHELTATIQNEYVRPYSGNISHTMPTPAAMLNLQGAKATTSALLKDINTKRKTGHCLWQVLWPVNYNCWPCLLGVCPTCHLWMLGPAPPACHIMTWLECWTLFTCQIDSLYSKARWTGRKHLLQSE